jgi:hypothetical protein
MEVNQFMQKQNEDWVPMVDAAKHFGISAAKVSRLAKQKKIEVRNKWGDERVKLVSLSELNAYMDNAARG